MNSYHFIGTGLISEEIEKQWSETQAIKEKISRLVTDCGMKIVSRTSADFEGSGNTLVWILAESHLVVHFWVSEGFITIDLHVCDYQVSNLDRAQKLKRTLSEYCFRPMYNYWQELTLPQPHQIVRSI